MLLQLGSSEIEKQKAHDSQSMGFFNSKTLTRIRKTFMRNHTSNSQLKVDGKMTSKGADRVGLMQGLALIILAIGVLGFAAAAILYAIK